jgi:hypothetical protein
MPTQSAVDQRQGALIGSPEGVFGIIVPATVPPMLRALKNGLFLKRVLTKVP